MASFTNRFHTCRNGALDLIADLLRMDAQCQQDAQSPEENLHGAGTVAQYHIAYAIERARAATVVPTLSNGPAKPVDDIETRDAYERFIENMQCLASRQRLALERCIETTLSLTELALSHAYDATKKASQCYEAEGLKL